MYIYNIIIIYYIIIYIYHVNTNFTLELWLWPALHQATSLRGWQDLRYPSWRVESATPGVDDRIDDLWMTCGSTGLHLEICWTMLNLSELRRQNMWFQLSPKCGATTCTPKMDGWNVPCRRRAFNKSKANAIHEKRHMTLHQKIDFLIHDQSCMKLPQSQGPFPIMYGIMVIHPKMRIYHKSKSLGFIIYAHFGIAIYILVGGFNHLEKWWSSSMGRMTSHR